MVVGENQAEVKGHTGNGAQPAARKPLFTRRMISLLMSLLILVGLGIMGSLAFSMFATPGNAPAPAVALTVWLIVGSAFLLVALMAFALLSYFIGGRKKPVGALGMPEGSISAILALMLLIIFSLFSVYLFSELRGGESLGVVSHGLTADALKALPQERIISVTVENQGNADTGVGRTYQVVLAASHTDSTDFGKTTAQTVGVLLTTVAGFYFGSKAVQAGVAATTDKKGKSAGGLTQEVVSGPDGVVGGGPGSGVSPKTPRL